MINWKEKLLYVFLRLFFETAFSVAMAMVTFALTKDHTAAVIVGVLTWVIRGTVKA